jgi:hypothetical protein
MIPRETFDAAGYRRKPQPGLWSDKPMQQPAIQAALDNLVEVIRTALTAEFLEYFRGEATAVRKGAKAGPKSKAAKKARSAKTGKRARRSAT